MTGSATTILVTGGCGFIGTHTLVCLLEAKEKYNVVVVDNLSNSSPISLDRVAKIVNLSDSEKLERIKFHKADLCDEDELRKVFKASPKFAGCIHFAGLKVSKRRMISCRIILRNWSRKGRTTFGDK